MTEHHPQRTPIVDAAYAYISKNNWTLVAVGDNKRPLGEWGPGGHNRYDYTNLERVFQINAPGIGVITGPSGLVIIDLDNDAAIKLWADTFGLPMTRVARTPRGRHLYFIAPPGVHIPPGTEILPGVDVRGAESYAILPPSRLAHGSYAWVNPEAPILPLPDNVCDLVLEAKPKRKAKILSGEPFAEGTRNDHLFAMACSMRRGGFDYTSILAALAETNKTRCAPPVAYTELESISESAMTYEEAPHSIDLVTRLRAQAATREADDAPLLEQYTRRLDTNHLVSKDPPAIDWVWDGFLAPGTLSMLHGEGGLGKSWLALKIAEQMLTTEPGDLFDKPVHNGGVVILDGENAENQIHSRIHYTRINTDADLNYYMVSDAILGLEEMTEQYIDYLVQTHKPRLIIIDSQRALWAGDEKEQAEAGRMLRGFARYIEHHPCAYLFIHHDNRGGDYSGSSDINAAITGCRLHLKRHTDKDKPNARILTQPKNRIAAEMPRQEFLLDINLLGRNHRYDISGIAITPYQSDESTLHKQRIEQVKTLALNKADGVSFRDIWSALDFQFTAKGISSTDRPKWDAIKADLEQHGFVAQDRGQLGGWIVKA